MVDIDARLDGIGFVEHVRHGRQAVGGAGRGGDDFVVLGQGILIDGEDDGLHLAGGRGDDHFLGAGVDVRLALFLAGIEACAFQHHVDAQFAPGAFLGVFDGVDGDLFPVHDDGIVRGFHRMQMLAEPAAVRALRRIIFQQMRKHRGAGQIVDGDHFVPFRGKHLAEGKAADTAETVDCYFDHVYSPPLFG